MKFIDLFSGIGGFRLGMEMAGHECVGHCEIDKYADKSYRAMHDVKEIEWYANDIRNVEPGDIPDFDCLCGGFPCQSFSIAGKRGGFEDTRGTLFFEIARIIQVRHPRFVFLENVAGLLSHDNGSTFETIIGTLDELGYVVEWQVLNSKNFGVPQNRERVFIIGHLRGKGGGQIFPIRGEIQNTITKVGDLDIKGQHESAQRIYGINGVSPCLNTCGGGGLEIKIMIIGNTSNTGHGSSDVYDVNGIVSTLCSRDYKGAKQVLQEFKIRKLTPLEYFRLQGFPDELFYKAQSVNSDSQLYKQAGNSVTVNVIYEIAKRLEVN